MVSNGGGVDVVATVIPGWAGIEGRVSVVLEFAVDNGEASSRSSTSIALELGGGWSKDAAAAVFIGQATVVDAVVGSAGSKASSLTNTVLAIGKLANDSRLTTSGGKAEATLISCNERSGRGAKGEAQRSVDSLHLNEELKR